MSELWELKEIKDSCELIMGQSPPGSSYNEEGEGMPFLQGKAEFGKTFPNHIKFTTNPKRKAKKGSILMSVRAPVGDVNIANIDYCIGRGLASLNLKNGDNKYLFYLLNYLKPKIEESGTGSTFKAITKSGLEKIKIPVPPLETQKKIVEILEKAEKLKEWRAEADELADELFNSYFLEMFGDPIKNENGFETDLLKNLCELKSGGTPSRKNSEYFEGNVPWITTVALGPKFIGYNDAVEYITEDAIQKSATKLIPANSIIFGTRVGVGKASINKCDICTNQDITSMVNLDKRLNRDFLLQVFKYYEKYFESQVRGATIKGITSKTLKELTIIIPPITLQNQFAQIVQQIETLKTHQAQSKQEIDNLFNTLMQKAFKGELVC